MHLPAQKLHNSFLSILVPIILKSDKNCGCAGSFKHFLWQKRQKSPKIYSKFFFIINRSYLVSLSSTRWDKLKNVKFVKIGCFVLILWNPNKFQDGRQKVRFLQYLGILWVRHTSVTHLESYFFKGNLVMHSKQRFKKFWENEGHFIAAYLTLLAQRATVVAFLVSRDGPL